MIDSRVRNYYLAATLKVSVRIESGVKHTALLDTGAEES